MLQHKGTLRNIRVKEQKPHVAQQASEAQQFSQRLQELTSLEAMILVRSLGHHIKSTGPFQAVMLIP